MFLFGTRTKTGTHVLCIGPISQPHAVRKARTGTLQTGGLETGFQCVEVSGEKGFLEGSWKGGTDKEKVGKLHSVMR